jgi:predicted SprT family Zn-dependent metalloprotease
MRGQATPSRCSHDDELEGENEMREFFMYTCRQCGAAYPGVLEVTERRQNQKETKGLCVACFERLFDLNLADRAAEPRNTDPGSAHKGEIFLGE